MLTIKKDVFEDAGDKVVVKLQEDQFGEYQVKVFVSFQKTKQFKFNNKKDAKEKFAKLTRKGLTKKEIIDKLAGKSITLTKKELEEKADLNIVWKEIAEESINQSVDAARSQEDWKITDNYLYHIEFTEEGIKYYEGTDESYIDVSTAEENWREPQWSTEEVEMLLEGIE